MRITSETTINPKHQTMNCPNCNSTLPDDARFCGHCGAAIPSVISTEPEPSESPEDGNDSGGQPSEPYTWKDGMCHGALAASFLLVLSLFYAAGWDFWFVRHIGRLFTCVAVLFFSAILFYFPDLSVFSSGGRDRRGKGGADAKTKTYVDWRLCCP